MEIREIQEFAEIRTKARAYFCYIISRNMPYKPESFSLETLKEALKKVKRNLINYESIYGLDAQGKQIINNISEVPAYKDKGLGKSRLDRAYYYRAVREKRCVITNPYPSLLGNTMVVTISYPIYDQNNKLLYIVCIDISLKHVLQTIHPSSVDSLFGKVSKVSYALFTTALFVIGLLLFVKSIESIAMHGFQPGEIKIKEIFESTILITLSLAIFDLVKTLFEEEVLGHGKKNSPDDIHKTMVRFLGSIIIALAIEALMLVFKFAMIDPNQLINAVYIIVALSILLIALSIYIKMTGGKKSSK